MLIISVNGVCFSHFVLQSMAGGASERAVISEIASDGT